MDVLRKNRGCVCVCERESERERYISVLFMLLKMASGNKQALNAHRIYSSSYN